MQKKNIILIYMLFFVLVTFTVYSASFPAESLNPYYDELADFINVSLDTTTGKLDKGLNASFYNFNITNNLILSNNLTILGNINIGISINLTNNGNIYINGSYFGDGSQLKNIIFKGINLSISNLNVTSTNITANLIGMKKIGTPRFSTIQDMNDIFHSAGWVSGGNITDNGDLTVDVTAGTGLIRAQINVTSTIFFFDWSASASVAIADGTNYIEVDYNSGNPIITISQIAPTNFQSKVLIGVVTLGEDNALHITTEIKHTIGDHANNMIRRIKDTGAIGRKSGGIISEVGTQELAVTIFEGWLGLTEFDTLAFDSSATSNFTYYYRDGSGGFTNITKQTQINETLYDDGTGTLATLSPNKYGVHWVYLEVDDDVSVIYGRDSYTLSDAQDALQPATTPDILTIHGFIIGKIIIKKDDTTFTSIESAFETVFETSPVELLWLNFNADSGSATADTTGDTLTVLGGLGITTSITGDTLTLTLDKTVNFTYVNVSKDLIVIGNITVLGNISANFYHGDGSLLTGISAGGTSVWNSSGSNVYLNDSTGKIGIGTNAPTIILAIGDDDTGLDSPAADEIGFRAGGIEFMTFIEAGTDITIFNDDSNDIDFRVETNNNANMFFINGGTDMIGIGTITPTETLTIIGNFSVSNTNNTLGNFSIIQFNSTCVGFRFNNSLDAGGIFSCMP